MERDLRERERDLRTGDLEADLRRERRRGRTTAMGPDEPSLRGDLERRTGDRRSMAGITSGSGAIGGESDLDLDRERDRDLEREPPRANASGGVPTPPGGEGDRDIVISI